MSPCNFCNGATLRRLPRITLTESALSLFFLYPHRCRACRQKQFKLNRRRMFLATAVSLPMVAIFAIVLTHSSSPGESAAAAAPPAAVSVRLSDSKDAVHARLVEGAHAPDLVLDLGSVAGNSDIVRLSRSGLSDAVILKLIGRAACRFQLDTGALVELRRSGVSSEVISAMLDAMAVDPAGRGTRRPELQ